MKIVITGIGWVNSNSCTQGRRAVFYVGHSRNLPKLLSKSLFHKPFQRFGRLDEYSQLGVAAIALALKDANLDTWSEPRNIAIIASTVYGCLGTDDRYYDTVIPEEGRLASPSLFAYVLPSAYLGEASIHFGLSGASFVINETSLSGLFGLILAMNSIKRYEHETVIVGICDNGPPPILSVTNSLTPGALFFVLQNGKAAKQHLAYGELTQRDRMKVFFNTEEITDLNALASMCTNGREI